MINKVLLTGISGWIAKHTAIELLNAGYEVLGTIRNKNLVYLRVQVAVSCSPGINVEAALCTRSPCVPRLRSWKSGLNGGWSGSNSSGES